MLTRMRSATLSTQSLLLKCRSKEEYMKKLFISCPMRNRTEYAIKASMEQMHRIAEAVFGEELEVIPTYFEGDPPENSNQAL